MQTAMTPTFYKLLHAIQNHLVEDQCGYILEVEFEYSKEPHRGHYTYPLAPERLMVLNKGCMSISHASSVEQRLPNWYLIYVDKVKHVFNCFNLQLHLSLKIHLKKMHWVLKFSEKHHRRSNKVGKSLSCINKKTKVL